MADTRVEDEVAAATLTGAEILYCVQGATPRRTTVNDVSVYALIASSAYVRSIVRTKLTADLILYLRTDGNDGHTGLTNTAGGALLTLDAACRKAINEYDPGVFDIYIVVADGAYSGNVTITGFLLGSTHTISKGRLQINGNSTTPNNVVFTCAAGDTIALNATRVDLTGCQITSPAGGGINVTDISNLGLHKVNFGACLNGDLSCGIGTNVVIWDNYTKSGNSLHHIHAPAPGLLSSAGITLTHSGAVTYAAYFAGLSSGGQLDFRNFTFAGTVPTGVRAVIHRGGVCLPPSSSLTALPGTLPVQIGAGGIYALDDENGVLLKAATFNIGAITDGRKYYSCSGTYSVTFDAVATLGTYFNCEIGNDGTGVITLDPSGAEQIYMGSVALTTLKLFPGERCKIVNDGTALRVLGLRNRVMLSAQTAASVAQLDFVNFDSTRFDSYEFEITDILPATDQATLQVVTSSNSGGTYDTTLGNYNYGYHDINWSAGTAAIVASASATNMQIATKVGNAGNQAVNGTFKIRAATLAEATWMLNYYDSNVPGRKTAQGGALGATVPNAVRFKFSAGNVASGTIRMYGIAKG